MDYECFLNKDTKLPMMYMPDGIRATLELMHAPKEAINVRSSYNLSGMSFDPQMIHDSIKRHYPDFKVNYKTDFRQEIADTWPQSIDDTVATKEWGWKPSYDLDSMVDDMIMQLKPKLLK